MLLNVQNVMCVSKIPSVPPPYVQKRHYRVYEITIEYVTSQVESVITPHSGSRKPMPEVF